MKAQQAYNSKITLECSCTSISTTKWDILMAGAKKADGKKIRAMIREQLPDLYQSLALNFYNPNEEQSQRTNTHLIYVHSAIEYFLKIH